MELDDEVIDPFGRGRLLLSPVPSSVKQPSIIARPSFMLSKTPSEATFSDASDLEVPAGCAGDSEADEWLLRVERIEIGFRHLYGCVVPRCAHGKSWR